MHLIQILLPLNDNNGKPFGKDVVETVYAELEERFGGFTVYARSPADGVWRDDSQRTTGDEIAVIEVMVEKLDRDWWGSYRAQLEERFRQDELVIRVTSISTI